MKIKPIPKDFEPGPRNIEISAVWIRRIGNQVEVLVETEGKWKVVAKEDHKSSFSHIVEATGCNLWPVDENDYSRKAKSMTPGIDLELMEE